MPALQVRDFPEDLYEELRSFAAQNHRSIAQQTIAAVDVLLHGSNPPSSRQESPYYTYPDHGDLRAQKRAGILARAQARSLKHDRKIPNPVKMLAESRSERNNTLDQIAQDIMDGNA